MLPKNGDHTKKKSKKAQERERPDIKSRREQFLQSQSDLDPEKLIFIDETGFNTAMSRNYARAMKGKRAEVNEPLKRSINHTLVGALGHEGIVTSMLLEGALDGQAFKVFLESFLAPYLKPGMVVVMDNLPAHKVQGIQDIITKTGASTLYLPPYSPELNPIEECWAKLKNYARKHLPRYTQTIMEVVADAIDTVTPKNCRGWFRHAGYCI